MRNFMNTMKPEIDKVQNIFALTNGIQIMLCKKRKIAEENELVFLWPSSHICHVVLKNLSSKSKKGGDIEECIFNKEKYESKMHEDCKKDHSIFLLSKKGGEYFKKNKVDTILKDSQKESKYFATLEYRDIKPYSSDGVPNKELFRQFEKAELFWLWDIDEGPLKLFTTKEENNRKPDEFGYIAIYRVYKCKKKDLKIRYSDFEPDYHGMAANLKKESDDRIRGFIKEYGLNPVIDDIKFNAMKKKLETIIHD